MPGERKWTGQPIRFLLLEAAAGLLGRLHHAGAGVWSQVSVGTNSLGGKPLFLFLAKAAGVAF